MATKIERHKIILVATGIALTMIAACRHSGVVEVAMPARISASQLSRIAELKEEHKASALGIGIINDGQLVWTHYLGEQSPGVPTSAATMFNTASVNKAVTTETFLRLAERGLVTLDEPVFPFYKHPDLVTDPRYRSLTPRIILTHRTGLLNWPHSYADNKLAFLHEPGSTYGYSGAGFMILAKFLEEKLEKPFPTLVRETVFDPVSMASSSIVQQRWMDDRVAHPLLEDGAFESDFSLDYGNWNSADDLYTTVEDYAKFLISVMQNDGVGADLAGERLRVQSDLTDDSTWQCSDGPPGLCPSPYGHGLGWFVFGYDGNLNVQHGGNDQSEAAIAYFETATQDGMIVFVNAPSPNGVLLWPEIVDVLDADAEFTKVFHHIIGKVFGPSE